MGESVIARCFWVFELGLDLLLSVTALCLPVKKKPPTFFEGQIESVAFSLYSPTNIKVVGQRVEENMIYVFFLNFFFFF